MLGGVIGKLLGQQLSLGEIMNIDAGRQERSKDCIVKLVKIFHILKEETLLSKFKSIFLNKPTLQMYYLVFKFEVKSPNNTHIVFIMTNPDYDIVNWKSNLVKVYCDCKDFMFRSAYLLDKNNTLFINDHIKTSLGQALTTAPKENTKTSLLCKHSFAAVNWLVNNYSSVMKTI